jgi:hypothetical protein
MAFTQTPPSGAPPPPPGPKAPPPGPPMGEISASAPKESPKPAGPAIRGISIDTADGGWIGRISEEFGGGMAPKGPPPKDRLLVTPEDVHAFVDEALGIAVAPPMPAEPPPDTAVVTEAEPLPDQMV